MIWPITRHFMSESLLFLPGLLCDATLWRDQITALAPLVAIEVADLTRDDHLDDMARRVLATLPDRFAVCGLSMGGYVALALMRIAPERVTRLCLMDTSARPDTAEQALRRRRLIAASGGKTAAETRFRGVTPRLLPWLLHRDRLADAPLVEAVMGMAERVGREAFLRQQTAIMNRPDSRAWLPAIAVPTLVAAGRDDILTPPEHAAEMQALIPGARLHLIESCGHLAPMERPDEVSAMLKSWLVAGV
jgi:pimeloyl-ACP methyl ester carboxylesterase